MKMSRQGASFLPKSLVITLVGAVSDVDSSTRKRDEMGWAGKGTLRNEKGRGKDARSPPSSEDIRINYI